MREDNNKKMNDLIRVCTLIDGTKVKWIDAREKLPEFTCDEKLYLVETHWRLIGSDKENEIINLAYYDSSQKIWEIPLCDVGFKYINALLVGEPDVPYWIDPDVPYWIDRVARWAYMPGDEEEAEGEDET